MTSQRPLSTIERFFTGLAEQTFEVKLGIVDPPLIDYLSDLLARCVRMEQLHSIRSPRGQIVRELEQMMKEAEARIGSAKRDTHRHIGDFAMFWTGLFPESLRETKSDADIDRFGEYCTHGKRAYLIASSIPTDDDQDISSDLLERLGLEFEMCAYGLREVRREWEVGDEGSAGPLLE